MKSAFTHWANLEAARDDVLRSPKSPTSSVGIQFAFTTFEDVPEQLTLWTFRRVAKPEELTFDELR